MKDYDNLILKDLDELRDEIQGLKQSQAEEDARDSYLYEDILHRPTTKIKRRLDQMTCNLT